MQSTAQGQYRPQPTPNTKTPATQHSKGLSLSLSLSPTQTQLFSFASRDSDQSSFLTRTIADAPHGRRAVPRSSFLDHFIRTPFWTWGPWLSKRQMRWFIHQSCQSPADQITGANERKKRDRDEPAVPLRPDGPGPDHARVVALAVLLDGPGEVPAGRRDASTGQREIFSREVASSVWEQRVMGARHGRRRKPHRQVQATSEYVASIGQMMMSVQP